MSETSPTPSASKAKYKRSVHNLLIHKPMQREFSLILIGLLMISTLAVAWVIHHTIHGAVFGGNAYRFGKISPVEILNDVSYELLIKTSSILFVTLIVVAIFGIFFLHRVAGPVHRFRYTMMRLNDGEIPHLIKLREGDFFGETAIEINRLIHQLQTNREKHQQMKKILDKILSVGSSHPAFQEAKELRTLLD